MPSPLLHVVAKFVITGLAEAHILAFTALNRDGAGSRQRLHQFGLWKTLPVFAKFDQHGWSQTRSQPRQGCENNVIRVLLVDDHEIVRQGLRLLLENSDDIEVVGEAADGAQALAVVAEIHPDVVLMDLRMAGGDGIDAIAALRADGRSRPRILVLTTYHSERDIRTALAAGADGYLLKDARRADIVRAIHDLVAGRPVLTAEALAVLTGRRGEAELTERELEALRLIAEGLTNRSAATRMNVSEAPFKSHLPHAFDKLGVGDRAAAVHVAYQRGLL